VSCAQTGLSATLRVSKDHSVSGVLEQQAAVGAAAGAAAGRPFQGSPKQLGVFRGSWKSHVFVTCPEMVSRR